MGGKQSQVFEQNIITENWTPPTKDVFKVMPINFEIIESNTTSKLVVFKWLLKEEKDQRFCLTICKNPKCDKKTESFETDQLEYSTRLDSNRGYFWAVKKYNKIKQSCPKISTKDLSQFLVVKKSIKESNSSN